MSMILQKAVQALEAASRASQPSEQQLGTALEALRDMLAAQDPLAGQSALAVQAGGYTRNRLHVDPSGRFGIWAMWWSPGAVTAIHDHHCWCAFGVLRGRVEERRYRVVDAGRSLAAKAGRRERATGSVSGALPGATYLHALANPFADEAVTLHVYGFDPSRHASSIGRVYEVVAEAGLMAQVPPGAAQRPMA